MVTPPMCRKVCFSRPWVNNGEDFSSGCLGTGEWSCSQPPQKHIEIDYWFYLCSSCLIAQLVKNPPVMQETRFNSWVRKIRWRRDRLPIPLFLGFPGGSAGKNPPAMWETGFDPWVGKIP